MILSQIFCSKVENITYLIEIWHIEFKIKHRDFNGKLISSNNFCWSLNVCCNNQSLIPHLMFKPVACYFWYRFAKEILKRPIYNTSFFNIIKSPSVNLSLFSFYKPFGISLFDQMTNFNVLKMIWIVNNNFSYTLFVLSAVC